MPVSRHMGPAPIPCKSRPPAPTLIPNQGECAEKLRSRRTGFMEADHKPGELPSSWTKLGGKSIMADGKVRLGRGVRYML